MENEKHFGLRIDESLLRRFRYICKYDHRSANEMLLFMIEKYVAEFEQENGVITQEDLNQLFGNK